MRRRFKRSERIGLYLSSGGKCAICGMDLQPSWHGDHVEPYSKGGETAIWNGQPLCPECNLKKGDRALSDEHVVLREFQQRFVDTALRKIKAGESTMVADVHPGSGKTLAFLVTADRMMAAGFIDQVVVFVPRLNLAAQFEQDWNEIRQKLPYKPAMRYIFHRSNEPPLLLSDADGYITTYDSLARSPQLHLSQIKHRRTLVCFDEAQQLGVDYDGQKTTESARWCEEVGKASTFTIVMSGTPIRADDSPLLFAKYSEKPDARGRYRLEPDVSSTYRDGVRDGYLRRFEALLHDGVLEWRDLLEGDVEMRVSEMEKSIRKVLQHSGYWQPMVDRFVERLRETKELVDSRMCGMIAATDQKHAKEILKYLKKRYPGMRALVAVSDDGEEAHRSLRQFREGRHDILVTVHMAYVGYDHKPITVMCILTHYRTEGYLRQLFARGLRVVKWAALEKQSLVALVPDDYHMQQFIKALREESDWGYQERTKRIVERDGVDVGGNRSQDTLGFIVSAWMTDVRAMGIDPTGDMTPDELEQAEVVRRRMSIPYPVTDLVAFARMFQTGNIKRHAPERPFKTMQERIKDERKILRDEASKCDYALEVEFGTTYKRLYREFGGPVTEATSLEEIQERIQTVIRWKEQGYYD